VDDVDAIMITAVATAVMTAIAGAVALAVIAAFGQWRRLAAAPLPVGVLIAAVLIVKAVARAAGVAR
jgi:hypothetical protein